MEYFDTHHRPRVHVLYNESIVAHGLKEELRSHVGLIGEQSAVEENCSKDLKVVVCDYATGLEMASHRPVPSVFPAYEDFCVLILTADASEQSVRRALEQGVQGYVLLTSPLEELIEGIVAVSRGRRFMSHAVAQCIADSLTHEVMTRRETEVLCLLAAGKCNKSIARHLQIAVGTVKAHVKSIMSKLDANSRTQAVGEAVLRGLVSSTGESLDIRPTHTRQTQRSAARAILMNSQPVQQSAG